MPRSGPDSARSWAVAGACCFINCLLYGVARLSGLLMVAAVETFRVTRAQAAAPFSVSSSVRNLSGLFVGHLGQHFGVRAVVCAGCLLASLGAGLCFFVHDVWWLTLCWGGLFGTGYGLATCLLPLAINQHFFKNCGTASGISYSGSYIGSFILPPVVVILLDNYGLPGTFLIISGAVLNVLAAAMLFGGKSEKKRVSKPNDYKSHSVSVIKDIESPSKKNTKSSSFWHCLLKSLNFKDTPFKTNKMANSSPSPPIDLTAAVRLDRDSLQCDHRLHTANNANNLRDIDSFTKTNILIPTASVLPISVPKISGDSRSFKKTAQDKSKMKYKAKLAKLKKIMSTSLFKKRHSFKVDLPGVHAENIKLISFRNWNCILCSNMIQMPIHPELLYSHMNLNNNKIIAGGNMDAIGMKNESFGDHINQNSSFPDRHRVSTISQPWDCQYTFPLKYKEKTTDSKENGTKIYFSDSIGERCCRKLSYEYQCRVPYERSSAVNTASLFSEHKKKRSKLRRPVCPSLLAKQTGSCFLGWMFLFGEPMYVVISLTMALYSFVIVCVITIIEDFAKDIHIPDSHVHYVLMVLSTADLIGTLTLGFITDRGYMSRRHFLALCFLGMGACTASLSLCTGTASLFACVGCYGLCESGVVITFPLLVAQFMPLRKQAVAIASSNIFSAPTVLLVPIVIGHFRDYIGCYSGVFYLMGVTSVTCGLLWIITPHIFCKKNSPPAALSNPS